MRLTAAPGRRQRSTDAGGTERASGAGCFRAAAWPPQSFGGIEGVFRDPPEVLYRLRLGSAVAPTASRRSVGSPPLATPP
jgi:hypothetical protein